MWVLRKEKAVEILFALSKGPKYVRELLSEVGGSASTLEECKQDLLKEGLIYEKKSDSWPFRRILGLTEGGKEVVRTIEFQGGLISSTVPKPPRTGVNWILALLHKTGEGKIRGRLRLVKLLFLLKHEYRTNVPYQFTQYISGPYSADIFQSLADLRGEDLLEVRGGSSELHEMVDDKKCMSFVLTKEGEERAKEIYEKLPAEAKGNLIALRHFNRMSSGKLIKFVYDKYPDFCP